MRTTVTLEKDVEQMLRASMHRTRQSFKDALNGAIRAGLAPKSKPSPAKPFVVEAKPMRLRTGIDPTRFNQLTDEMEIDAWLGKSHSTDAG